MAYVADGGYPELATIRGWIKVAATTLSDDELGHVAGAERSLQTFLAWPGETIPEDVYQAFLRRCARHVAARGVPLGFLGLEAETGPQALRRWDAEIERLEAPYSVPVVA